MARYPTARWDPAGTPGGTIAPRVVIVHSEATKGGLARPNGGPLEWHFMVRSDGTVIQHVDTERRADANRDANNFAISIETEDRGDPDHEPWTDKQLVAIVDLIAWCCDTHGIPRTRCDAWDGSGVGFHTMWGAPSHWTPVVKTCPGAARKAQFPLILDRLDDATAAAPTPEPEKDDDMPGPNTEAVALADLIDRLYDRIAHQDPSADPKGWDHWYQFGEQAGPAELERQFAGAVAAKG